MRPSNLRRHRAGGAAPAWLNAANEVAVEAFLAGRISWVGIAEVLTDVLDRFEPVSMGTVEDVVRVDKHARAAASATIEKRNDDLTTTRQGSDR